MNPVVDLRFGTPQHGWLSVTLTGCGGVDEHEVSDVPGDSLRQLAFALCDAARGEGEWEVTWFLEPAELRWRFVRTGGELRLFVGVDRRPQRLLVVGPAAAVCLSMWRALRRLEADPAWRCDKASAAWSNEFPTEAVAALGAALGRGCAT